MLAFPASNWDKAFAATGVLRGPRNAAVFGRTASQITPRLYLSDYWTARDEAKLEALGITHVISVIDFVPKLPEVIQEDRKMHVPLMDNSDADILSHLDSTTTFITDTLSENDTNKVLVHCLQGISRSATVVCAYLVASEGMTGTGSVAHVQAIRGIVCPNIGFRRQLEQYSTRYVKLQPRRSQISLPEAFKLSGGIAARIRKFRKPSGDEVERAKVPKDVSKDI